MRRDFASLRHLLRARWLRCALVALLLLAQHGALTHALAHAGGRVGGGHAVTHSAAHLPVQGDSAPVKKAASLCAFDQVYSQVFGVVMDAAAGIASDPGMFEQQTLHSYPRIVAATPPFFAQGPPTFL